MRVFPREDSFGGVATNSDHFRNGSKNCNPHLAYANSSKENIMISGYVTPGYSINSSSISQPHELSKMYGEMNSQAVLPVP
jgi:hypothetical protein